MRDNFLVALAAAAFVMLVVATSHLKHIMAELETIANQMEKSK